MTERVCTNCRFFSLRESMRGKSEPFCRYRNRFIGDTILCSGWERKPTIKTNADRIRAMSVAELAHFMMRTTDCPCVARANGCCRSDISCQKAWLDWLKEGADHD